MSQQHFEEQNGPLKNSDQADENSRSDEQAGKKKKVNAAQIDSIISSPTNAVHARHASGQLSSTGTNVSYEGASAPGGGGSVGTGEASGQSATGSRITATDPEEAAAGTNHPYNDKRSAEEENQESNGESPVHKEDHDDEAANSTLGTP